MKRHERPQNIVSQGNTDMKCKNRECTIQALDEHVMTWGGPNQPITLSQRRRICAQVENP